MFFIDELSLLMISFWMFFLFSLQLLSLVYQLSRNGLYSMSNGNSLEWGILNLNWLLFDDWKLIRLFIVIVQSIRQYINYKGWNYCRWQSLPFNPKVCWKKKKLFSLQLFQQVGLTRDEIFGEEHMKVKVKARDPEESLLDLREVVSEEKARLGELLYLVNQVKRL